MDKVIGKKLLVGAKHAIWNQIENIMISLRSHFELIQQIKALSSKVQFDINKVVYEMGDKVQVAYEVIIYLNRSALELATL